MPIDEERSEGQTLYRITRGGRLLGIVAIDSTVAGRARGGLRLVPDLTEAEIRAAARAMTLKYGFLGFPHGGAKAGVVGDGEAAPEIRHQTLAAFAAEAAPLLRTRRYLPDADLGTTAADVHAMLAAIGVRVPPRERRHPGAEESGLYTAYSVVAAARAQAVHAGIDLEGATAAIEGFGSVGSSVARLLAEAGARVVAVSTSRGALVDARGLDVERLLDLRARAGSRMVDALDGVPAAPREALLEQPVDLLLPCARFHGIHAGNVERVRARAICAGANDPISPEAERALAARGVHLLPDFVTNSGGVLGGTLAFFSTPPARIRSIVEGHIAAAVPDLLRAAAARGTSARAVAEGLALARHEAARAGDEHPGAIGRILRAGLTAYRWGWVPRAAIRPLAERHLARRIAPSPAAGEAHAPASGRPGSRVAART